MSEKKKRELPKDFVRKEADVLVAEWSELIDEVTQWIADMRTWLEETAPCE